MQHPTWERLNDFVDGDLSRAEARETEDHLRTCGLCREDADALRTLRHRAERLSPDLEPEHDLWPGIRAGLDGMTRTAPAPPAAPPRRWWLGRGIREAMAAAAALAILVAGGRLVSREPGAPDRGAFSFSPSRAPLAEMIPSLVFGLERESQGAGRTLQTATDAGRRAPVTETEGLEAGLRVLDQAISESLAALRQDPENPLLLKKVAGYYRLRLQILDGETLRGGPA